MMSRMAAPSSDVTMPILRGRAGRGRLRAPSNKPSACRRRLQLIEGELQRAKPVRLHALADDLIFALGLVDAQTAPHDDVQAVFGLEFRSVRTSDLNITALICAPGSFSVKYRWPVFQSRQLEISASTQTSAYAVSSTSRMLAVRSLTVKTVRWRSRARAGVGSVAADRLPVPARRTDQTASSCSSSFAERLRRWIDDGLSGGFICSNQDAVESRVAGSRFPCAPACRAETSR